MSHIHTHTLSVYVSLTHTLTHTLSLAHIHTHTHSLTHTHTHTDLDARVDAHAGLRERVRLLVMRSQFRRESSKEEEEMSFDVSRLALRVSGVLCAITHMGLSRECFTLNYLHQTLIHDLHAGLRERVRLLVMRSQFKNNYFTKMSSGSEEGSYLRLIDFCITQL